MKKFAKTWESTRKCVQTGENMKKCAKNLENVLKTQNIERKCAEI